MESMMSWVFQDVREWTVPDGKKLDCLVTESEYYELESALI